MPTPTSNPGKTAGKCNDDFIEELPYDDTFTIGYYGTSAILLRCKICKTTKLNVGTGDCITYLRCPNCEWEILWHYG